MIHEASGKSRYFVSADGPQYPPVRFAVLSSIRIVGLTATAILIKETRGPGDKNTDEYSVLTQRETGVPIENVKNRRCPAVRYKIASGKRTADIKAIDITELSGGEIVLLCNSLEEAMAVYNQDWS